MCSASARKKYVFIGNFQLKIGKCKMQNLTIVLGMDDSVEDELRGLVTEECNARQLLRKSYIAIEHSSSSAAS